MRRMRGLGTLCLADVDARAVYTRMHVSARACPGFRFHLSVAQVHLPSPVFREPNLWIWAESNAAKLAKLAGMMAVRVSQCEDANIRIPSAKLLWEKATLRLSSLTNVMHSELTREAISACALVLDVEVAAEITSESLASLRATLASVLAQAFLQTWWQVILFSALRTS